MPVPATAGAPPCCSPCPAVRGEHGTRDEPADDDADGAGTTVDLPAAAAVLLLSLVLASLAEVLHAPASAAWVAALAGTGGRGRYLAVFQYSFVVAELVGPALFAGLFVHAAALPFLAVAVANALTVPALHAAGRAARR